MEKTEIKNKEESEIKIARVRGLNAEMSQKYAINICKFIKNKKADYAIELLKKVQLKKIAVPMKMEVAHKKGVGGGYSSGKYPIKAAGIFIKLIKSLIANASVLGMDEKNIIIMTAKADKAHRPFKGTRMAYGRKKAKRCHVLLEAKEIKEKNIKKEKKESSKKQGEIKND